MILNAKAPTPKTYDPNIIRQIKTVTYRVEAPQAFDNQVNAALKEGWKLTRRYTMPAGTERDYAMLVAEMHRFVNKDELN